MKYTIDLEGYKKELDVCKVTEDLYIGAFVMFGDVELTKHCAKKLLEKCNEFDYIVAPESKAIPLAYEMSAQTGKEYIVARKKAKAYMKDVFKVDVKSITTMGVQTLILDNKDAEEIKGKKVLIVDDVVSTGESLYAVQELVKKAGGIIVDNVTPVAEGEASERKDIIYLAKLPLFDKEGKEI